MHRYRLTLQNCHQTAVLPASYHPFLRDGLEALFKPADLWCCSGFWLEKPFLFREKELQMGDATIEFASLGSLNARDFVGEILTIAGCVFRIVKVKEIPGPELYVSRYTAASPITIPVIESGRTVDYLEPGTELFESEAIDRLYEIHLRRGGERLSTADCKIELLSPPRRKLIQINADSANAYGVSAWLCDLQITAHIKLQRIAFYAGLGSFQELGLGMIGHKTR